MHDVAVWWASTAAEHLHLPDRRRLSTNAPGRIAGSREHACLMVARTRDERHGLCSVTSTRLGAATSTDATDATASAPSRRAPQRCTLGISPRTCRALRRAPRCEPRAHDARGHARCGRLVGEHGRRAPAPARSPAPLHECPRQDRGESRARLPHGRAHTRRTPRPLLQTTSALATNATASAPSPLHVSTHQATRADATDATASAP
jgi:hypothetical protein